METLLPNQRFPKSWQPSEFAVHVCEFWATIQMQTDFPVHVSVANAPSSVTSADLSLFKSETSANKFSEWRHVINFKISEDTEIAKPPNRVQ